MLYDPHANNAFIIRGVKFHEGIQGNSLSPCQISHEDNDPDMLSQNTFDTVESS